MDLTASSSERNELPLDGGAWSGPRYPLKMGNGRENGRENAKIVFFSGK